MKKPKSAKTPKVKTGIQYDPKSAAMAAAVSREYVKKIAESEDFLADVPSAKAPNLRPPMKRDALEEGYHALEASRIDHAKALRELSGDMGRLAHLIALYLPSERREDFKREAADILNRKQEQS